MIIIVSLLKSAKCDIKKSWIEITVDSNDSKIKFRKMINFNE